jgi:hypothetical protein
MVNSAFLQQCANHCCYKISTIVADYNNGIVIRPHLFVSMYGQLQQWVILKWPTCLLLRSSKLQSEITLSTTEAEYIALSQATFDIIPMRALLH